MRLKLKRMGSGVAVLAVAASLVAPLINLAPAFANGSSQGTASPSPSTGDSDTAFTLNLPAGAACPGDSTNSFYRWQTFIAPTAVDPASLTFGSAGPNGPNVHPLFDTTGNPVVNQQTQNQTTSNGPGVIANIPNMRYTVFNPGDIPAGDYNIGIACTLGPANEVVTLNNATGGTFTLTFDGDTTAAINASPGHPTTAEVQSALAGLPKVNGLANVKVAAGSSANIFNVTFPAGTYASTGGNTPPITGDSTNLTGPGSPAPSISVANNYATQTSNYWSMGISVVTPGGGHAQFNWGVPAKPAAPTLNSVAPDNGTLTAAFTPVGSIPVTSGFTVTATPAGGAPVTATGSASPITVPGLTNGTVYSVTVHATNSLGNSPESNALSTTVNPPIQPAVNTLTATPGVRKVDLSWSPPTSGQATTGYIVDVAPDSPPGSPSIAGYPVTLDSTSTSTSVTGLTPGTVYDFTVTPLHASPYVGAPKTVQAAANPDAVFVQDITTNRPVGALVLTQVCGVNGAIGAEAASNGFPGGLPAVAAVTTGGTAPKLDSSGHPTTADPKFNQYPYPQNADGTPAAAYPTHCGIDLGVAKFVTSGTGAGQFFATSGVLNQVTVVDTRDTDIGWTVNGNMSPFTAAGGTKTFSGSQLGWTPVKTSDSPAFTDSSGNTYDQVVAAGPVVVPNATDASGLSSGGTLGKAAARAGLGIAVLDARLKLLIPVTAKSGDYTATLTLSAI